MRAFVSGLFLSFALLGCGSSTSTGEASTTTPPSFPLDALTTATTSDGSATVEVRTSPVQPPTRGVLDVELFVRDRNGAPVPGLTLSVVPWMDAHGHGASVVPTVTDEGNGKYWLSDVDLFMPGQWDLRVSMSGPLTDKVDPQVEVQ